MKISVDIYTTRLLFFSMRINKFQQVGEPIIRETLIISENKDYLVPFDMIYFFELPIVFDEWDYYEPADEVEVKEYPKHLGMAGMIMQFFNITGEEFIDLFGFKQGLTARDMAINIQEFVRKKLMQ